nr:unnamed protein product [Digitaria exilis]
MASSAAVERLRELTPALGADELDAPGAAALAECCAALLRPGGGDGEAAREALEALCAAGGGGAMRRHAEGLAPLVVARLGDADAAVREAARRFFVLLMEMKEMNARTESTQPNSCTSNSDDQHCTTIKMESSATSQLRTSSKEKISSRDISILAGEGDITRTLVEPIKVFSEKDLLREIEKVISILQPDNEWSIRITAMQRVEGLVLGGSFFGLFHMPGAADYSAFPMLLKQLVTPLITQLLDRRSSVVKQACHLLNFLSKELLRDFEPYAELLIPVLLKNVVITILVIAESADNCIKEMLRNCKVARILPRIIESAKNDRSAILRARCCEYAILMLEYWVDTPEIQRSANLYEDLVKCCIADATSEMINDEDAETHQRQLSPIQNVELRQPQPSSCIPAVMDKVVKVDSETSFSSGDLQSSQRLHLLYDDMTSKVQDQGSKDDISAIGSSFEDKITLGMEENTSRGTDKCDSDNNAGVNSSFCDLPSATPVETGAPSEMPLTDAAVVTIVQDKAECISNPEERSSQQVQRPEEFSELTSLTPTINLRESGNLLKQNPVEVISDVGSGGKLGPQQEKKHSFSTPKKSAVSKEPRNTYTPNFRRPLLSKQMTNWFYASTKSDLDEKKLILGEAINNMDVPSSLTEALSLGLNPRSDWMMKGRHTERTEFESSNESYGHKSEMIDKKSSTMRPRNGLPRRIDFSVMADNIVQSASRDSQHMKIFDEPNAVGCVLMSTHFQNLHQMSSSLLEMLDDPDVPTRELALSVLVEILEKHRKVMESCVEILIVKLLHATKDAALKVVNQAHICLTTVVTQFDPLRCLGAISSQLACQDEKILIIIINSLSKLVVRLSQESLMAHLSTFLPALLDAFENHSPYVRKAVMVCVVDTYLKLGPSLLPYLEGLDGAQLQLVTTYASRLSQARFIAADG